MSNDLSAPHSQPRRAGPGRAGQHFMITADPRCGVVSQIRKCWPGHRLAPARWSSSGPPSCKAPAGLPWSRKISGPGVSCSRSEIP